MVYEKILHKTDAPWPFPWPKVKAGAVEGPSEPIRAPIYGVTFDIAPGSVFGQPHVFVSCVDCRKIISSPGTTPSYQINKHLLEAHKTKETP